jgi:immune inhibitor A
MARSIAVPAGTSALTFQANYNIEDGYDYAYVEVDDGTGYKTLPGTGTDPEVNNGLTGDSAGAWKALSFDTSAYAGKTVNLRIRYKTDGGVQGNDPSSAAGIFIDDIQLGTFTDGAETSPNGWTLDKFASVGASVTQAYDNYYIASNRTYTSYDKYLKTGPYNFGFPSSKPDFVEHYPYQNGLLVSYWDTSQSDNNTSTHPGSGLILPIDSHPRALVRLDGGFWRSKVAGYDAPFGLEKADSFTLTFNEVANYIRGQAAVPTFRDDKSYYDPATPMSSVKVPNTGTTIKVLSQDGTSMGIRISKR